MKQSPSFRRSQNSLKKLSSSSKYTFIFLANIHSPNSSKQEFRKEECRVLPQALSNIYTSSLLTPPQTLTWQLTQMTFRFTWTNITATNPKTDSPCGGASPAGRVILIMIFHLSNIINARKGVMDIWGSPEDKPISLRNMPVNRQTLTILQHNVQTWNTKRHTLANIYNSIDPDILLLNETSV